MHTGPGVWGWVGWSAVEQFSGDLTPLQAGPCLAATALASAGATTSVDGLVEDEAEPDGGDQSRVLAGSFHVAQATPDVNGDLGGIGTLDDVSPGGGRQCERTVFGLVLWLSGWGPFHVGGGKDVGVISIVWLGLVVVEAVPGRRACQKTGTAIK